jgi:membrane-bound lytic murein transglycosylase A
MTRRRTFGVAAALWMTAAGCKTDPPPAPSVPARAVEFSHPLPPGTFALRKLNPDEYPDFTAAGMAANLPSVLRSIDQSLKYFTAASTKKYSYPDIDHDRAVATLTALRQLVAGQLQHPDDGRQFDVAVKSQFDVYQSIGGFDPNTGHYTGEVLFTAYFTPTYDASPIRGGRFQWPVYKRPLDLVTPDADHAYRKSADGGRTPYYSRRQIEQGHALDGGELVWLADRFDAYVVTIQGSARLRMPDGTIMEIGYAGFNGYDYISPGLKMIADGLIPREKISLQVMRQYFNQHPEAMDTYLTINDRDVFFAPTHGGPFGSIGVPVTPLATIATDKSVYPAGMPALVVGSVPDETGGIRPFTGIMLDQDRGGAIRSAGRCDIYMGLGEQAGQELDVGKLYYLAVKNGVAHPS